MSVVVTDERSMLKKIICVDLMWRDAGEFYGHAIQMQGGGGIMMLVYLGKGKCMYFTFMQKKSIQIKHVNTSPCMK